MKILSKAFFLILLSTKGSFVFSQIFRPECRSFHDSTKVAAQAIQAEYPGGFEAMMKFISKKMRYPKAARAAKVEGSVRVQFTVGIDGSISNVEVLQGIHPDCDKEAVRLIKLMPRWKPGRLNGEITAVNYSLPIRFRL